MFNYSKLILVHLHLRKENRLRFSICIDEGNCIFFIMFISRLFGSKQVHKNTLICLKFYHCLEMVLFFNFVHSQHWYFQISCLWKKMGCIIKISYIVYYIYVEYIVSQFSDAHIFKSSSCHESRYLILATFREILLSSTGKVNDVYSRYI